MREIESRVGFPLLEVSERDFASASSTDSPQGILVIAEIPRRDASQLAFAPRARVRPRCVQDPGNVGTMLRTAAALGADATLATPGTVDLWNAKVVRSAMGALFHYPALACTWQELDSPSLPPTDDPALGRRRMPANQSSAIAPPTSVALVVGQRGRGHSRPKRDARCERLVGSRSRRTSSRSTSPSPPAFSSTTSASDRKRLPPLGSWYFPACRVSLRRLHRLLPERVREPVARRAVGGAVRARGVRSAVTRSRGTRTFRS